MRCCARLNLSSQVFIVQRVRESLDGFFVHAFFCQFCQYPRSHSRYVLSACNLVCMCELAFPHLYSLLSNNIQL
jgi:hypothetical protein